MLFFPVSPPLQIDEMHVSSRLPDKPWMPRVGTWRGDRDYGPGTWAADRTWSIIWKSGEAGFWMVVDRLKKMDVWEDTT